MTETQVLINSIVFIVNCCAIAFICVVVTRWIQRVEQKIDLLNRQIDMQLKRLDSVYMSQLLSLQQMYVSTEQYKSAAQVQKLIEAEVKLQEELSNEKSVQN